MLTFVSVILAIIATFYVGVSASAESLCAQFYLPKAKVADFISSTKMKSSGFKTVTEKSGRVLLYTRERNPILLGELKLLDVPMLFEWKDRARHETWVRNKGLSNEDLTHHFYNSHNWLEKGLSVSTHIADSAHYGDTLTVFPSQGPMLVLKPEGNSNTVELTGSPEGAIRLQGAGVDAIYIGKGTWYAIIQDKHLKNPTGVTAKAIAESTHSLADAFDLAMRGNGKWLSRIQFWELLPKNHILHRIHQGKKLTRQEKLRVGSLIREKVFPARTSNPGTVEIFFYEHAVPLYIEQLQATADANLTAKIEKFLKYYGKRDARLDFHLIKF